MYKNIISNTGPYRETSYWISDYGDVKCHLHKDSEAYKFFSSKVYKDSIAFGKVTNVVMPFVSNVMTGYVVYKRFIVTTPNKYNKNLVIVTFKGKQYKYSNSVLEKMENDPHYYNFPKQLDKDILSNQVLKRADGRCEYLALGNINKEQGVYHITTKGDLIIHRVFIPESDWSRFAVKYGLPSFDNIPRLK